MATNMAAEAMYDMPVLSNVASDDDRDIILKMTSGSSITARWPITGFKPLGPAV